MCMGWQSTLSERRRRLLRLCRACGRWGPGSGAQWCGGGYLLGRCRSLNLALRVFLMIILSVPNFIAANGTLLTAFNPSFFDVDGPMWVQNNGAVGSVGGATSITGVASGAWQPDQYAQGIVSLLDPLTVGYVGYAVRCGAAGSGNGIAYLSTVAPGNSFMLRYVAGVFSILGTGAAWASGDFIRIDAVGNVFTPWRNGVVADIGPVVDGTYATGVGAVAGFRDDPLSLLGDFETGNVGAGAPSIWPLGL